MTRALEQIQNIVNLEQVFPFFAVEMMFDVGQTQFADTTIGTGPLYLWTGLGDLIADGKLYTGTGNLISISEVTETADLRAQGATLTLSGIPPEIVALALTEPYQGRVCRIKFGMIDANADRIVDNNGDIVVLDTVSDVDVSSGDPVVLINIFTGYMDTMEITESADTATISINLENRLADLEIAKTRRYTSEFQKERFPNDKAFDYVNDLQDKKITWSAPE